MAVHCGHHERRDGVAPLDRRYRIAVWHAACQPHQVSPGWDLWCVPHPLLTERCQHDLANMR